MVSRTWPVWTSAELERLRRDFTDRVPIADIAAAGGRTPNAVAQRVQILGLTRQKPGDYTPDEDWRLQEMIETRMPYTAVAAALGRSVASVRNRAKHLGVSLTRANGCTIGAISRLLGVDSKAVARWVALGALRASGPISPMGNGDLRMVDEEAWLRFLGAEAWWHLWEPARITDPALRAWAIHERRGLVFLTTREVGDRLGLTHYRVNQLIHAGRIRGVKHTNWMVRSDWLEAAAIALRRSGPPPSPKGRHLGPADERTIRRWWRRVPTLWIAWRLGVRASAVNGRARAMGLEPVGRGRWRRSVDRMLES